MFRVIKGRAKRRFFALQLMADRRLSGRSQSARHYRPTGRKALTRAEALALYVENRRLVAGSLRADRRRARSGHGV